jgi:hypothetical protein
MFKLFHMTQFYSLDEKGVTVSRDSPFEIVMMFAM